MNKTQYILAGTRQQLMKVKCKSISLDGVDIPFSDDVTCWGVMLDNELKFYTKIKWLAGKYFYHLYQMHSVYCSLSNNVAKKLVNMFIISRIDYYYSVFSSVAANSSLPATIGTKSSCMTNPKEAQVWSDYSNHPWYAAYGYRFRKESNASFVTLSIKLFIRLLQYI